MSSTLITGGAGFIGSHLAKALLSTGEPVVCLDNMNDYYNPALKWKNVEQLRGPRFTFVEGDIRNAETVNTLFHKYDVDRVVHLAAMPGVRASVDYAELYMDVNATGMAVVLDAARRYSVDIFINASTSSVYGNNEPPFVETQRVDYPLAPYPASKRAAELLAESYSHLFDLSIYSLRFFNVYGPAGRPDMMPFKVLDATAQQKRITLFNHGNMWRDWTYISDVVDGIMAALQHPPGSHEIVNIGRGSPTSMIDFVKICEQLVDFQLWVDYKDAPLTEPCITHCDNSKARDLFGFEPKINLDVGLYKTWEWYQEAILEYAVTR